MVKVTKMYSSTVWYNLYCWKISHCVVLYLYILYMGFCGNGYHPFSKWMILLRGLNCPSSISFVEVSEREIVKVISVLTYYVAPWKTNEKFLKNNSSPRVGCCWATSRGLVSVNLKQGLFTRIWINRSCGGNRKTFAEDSHREKKRRL